MYLGMLQGKSANSSNIGYLGPMCGKNLRRPRYRRIGPEADLSTARANHGLLYHQIRFCNFYEYVFQVRLGRDIGKYRSLSIYCETLPMSIPALSQVG